MSDINHEELTVGDVMSHPAVTIGGDATLEDAAALMLEHRISCLPVVDEYGKYQGLLTDRSFFPRHRIVPFSSVKALWLHGGWIGRIQTLAKTAEETRQRPVREIAENRPGLRATTSLSDAANRLLGEEVHHLVVLDQGVVVGVISRRDLIKLFGHRPDASPTEAGDGPAG